jgi:biotin transport system substrate-specific component
MGKVWVSPSVGKSYWHKSYWQRCNQPVQPSVSGVSLLGLLLAVVVLCGFITLRLPVLTGWLGHSGPWLNYTPILALALSLGGMFSARMGLITMVAYLLLGLLCWPVFANGGGVAYWQQPGFSYLLAMPLGAWVCGRLCYGRSSPFKHNSNRPFNVWMRLIAAVGAVVLVHAIGAIGLCVQSMLGCIDPTALPGWLTTFSLLPMGWDVLWVMAGLVIIAPLWRLSTTWVL